MLNKHVSFFANISKSQIKETKTHFNIEGVPVTVDDAVMNGLLYSAEHNKAGMDTILDRVVTLSHPTNKDGMGADAYAGKSLQEFYSGGHIESVYSNSGVWYVNISIDKALLAIQDEKQNTDFVKRLSNKDAIGVSTGLYTEAKKESGINANGDKYEAIATKQQYNHLAMLNSSEPPAGGDATFMRFNNESGNVVVNIADYMPDSNPEQITDKNPDENEFNGLLAKLLALLGISKLSGNEESQTNADNAEDKAMPSMKDKMAALKAKDKLKDNMSEDEVNNAYDQMMKGKDAESEKGKANNSELLSAINTLTETVTTLNSKVESLESQVNAKETQEIDTLVEQLKDLNTGLTENTLKTLPADELKSMLLNATGKTFSLNGDFNQNNASDDDYSDSFVNTEAN